MECSGNDLGGLAALERGQRRCVRAIMAASVLGPMAASVAGQTVSDDFDDGTTGWASRSQATGELRPLRWSAVGGDPGGYAFDDQGGGRRDANDFVAPARYHGDKSAAAGEGSLAFRWRSTRVRGINIVLTDTHGNTLEARVAAGGLVVGSWNAIERSFGQTINWQYCPSGTGCLVSTLPQIAAVLASIADVTISGAIEPDEVVSLDTVRLLAGPGEPCRADLDADGDLTIFDFLAFGNLFDLMDPIADFDGDGDFTIFDFLAFQNAFDAGCG